VTLGNTITINVLKIAHVNVPAAIDGYRFKYAKTRQTVFIAYSTSSHPRSRQGEHAFVTDARRLVLIIADRGVKPALVMKAPSARFAFIGSTAIVMILFGCCIQQPTGQLFEVTIGDPNAKPPKFVELKNGLEDEPALRAALGRVKAHGGLCQIEFLRHDGEEPDRHYCDQIPARLKTERIIKSAAANKAARDSSAANDPHVTYKIASSDPTDITGVLNLLK
jgi:hypothetical protein